MKKLIIILILFVGVQSTHAQVLIMTVGSLVKSGDSKMVATMNGSWHVTKWIDEGVDKTSMVEGVIVTFEKCKKEDRKNKMCEAKIIFPNEEISDVIEYIGSDKFNFQIDTKKQSKKEAEVSEGIDPDQVPKGETFKLNSKEYKYTIKYKKKKLYFDTVDIVEEKNSHLILTKIKEKKKKKNKDKKQ